MIVKTTDNPGLQQQLSDFKSPAVIVNNSGSVRFLADPDELLTRSIGTLEIGKNIHFYSWANFNLVKLILYLLKQTGPSSLMMTSYSFSQKSIEALNARKVSGLIRDIKVLVDNRVKVMSPKPFQMLAGSFEYRCTSVHAKVALIWNDIWRISIITSQNATDNPKLERGIIYTDPKVFEFDFNTLSDEFNRGSA